MPKGGEDGETLKSHLSGSRVLSFVFRHHSVIRLLNRWVLMGINSKAGDFPGGPLVKEPALQCRGRRFDPWSGS